MSAAASYSASDLAREKQESRARDEARVDMAEDFQNGFFSKLDRSKVKIRRSRGRCGTRLHRRSSIKKRRRWKLPNGTILEWDYQHGRRVEMFNKRGNAHLGEYDAYDWRQTGKADPTRHAEP